MRCVPRNAEVIRQWAILREIERVRAGGVTIDELATRCGVTTRTIRRDLQALEEAGFPLFDDRSHEDGRTRWRINGQPFKGLAAGLTIAELCALYFSRTLVESLTGTPFREDVESAFEKLALVLTPHMRQFLDQLPRIIATKPDPIRHTLGEAPPNEQQIVARTLDATLHQRVVILTYHSQSSGRTKPYHVHPYRLAYAVGRLYLLAYVPEYREIRTFAVDRIQEISLLEERFAVVEELPETVFPDSLGVYSGSPEPVEIAFRAEVADYVKSTRWHPSQALTDVSGGRVVMRLNVCIDRALRSFVLGFGPFARVVSPESLARDIAGQLERALAEYASHQWA